MRVGGILRDRAEADDVMQGVWLRVHRSAARFNWRSRVSTWLYRLARHQALTAIGASQRSVEGVTLTCAVSDASVPGPDMLADQRRTLTRIRSVLPTLTPREREAFVLSIVEGETSPVSTRRVHLRLARAKLRRVT